MKNVIYRFCLLLMTGLSVVSKTARAQTAQPPEDLPNPIQVGGKYTKLTK
jgi:hypothetical protein